MTALKTYSERVVDQIRRGAIVCPATRSALTFLDDRRLVNSAGRVYRVLGGRLPVLIENDDIIDKYAQSSERMNKEYSAAKFERREGWFTRLERLRTRAYPTPDSSVARASIYEDLTDDAICLAIGGGPTRAEERLINLNIGPFPNVDIIGDAHQLPYADDSIDAISCEAVFEHLHTPTVAAAELSRVLKKGRKAYVCTPFLQIYHGYPDHYQNFTLTGHRNLFERAGLRIVASGACIGPTFTLRHIVASYIANYAPHPVDKVLRALWAGPSFLIAPLDILIGKKADAHIMASTTYVVAQKP